MKARSFTSPAKLSLERSLVMNDRNYILLMKDDIRHLVEIPVKGRIEAIGFTRYSNLFHVSGKEGTELVHNGSYPVISADVFNELYGKILTLIDAAFPEGGQKEAFKTLARNELSGWYDKNVSYTIKMTEQLHEKEVK